MTVIIVLHGGLCCLYLLLQRACVHGSGGDVWDVCSAVIRGAP